jgi:hypothetical protein
MKQFISIIAIAILFTAFASCEKDEGKLPNIAFKTTAGYTSANATVAMGDSIKVGIDASKSEDKDVLKTFTINKAIGSASGVDTYSEALSGSTGDAYSHDIWIHAGAVTQTEKYTFTVVNKDGLTKAVNLTVTIP